MQKAAHWKKLLSPTVLCQKILKPVSGNNKNNNNNQPAILFCQIYKKRNIEQFT